MRSKGCVFIKVGTLVSAVFLLAALFASAAWAAPGGDAAQGKALYDKDCASCHGANLAGGLKIGNATSADVRWDALDKMYDGDVSLARRAILTGKDEDGEDMDTAMPRWQGKLSDADVNNIIAYLQTTGTEQTSSTATKTAAKQASPTSLPKTGSPLGPQSLPWIAGLAAILGVAGFGIWRRTRSARVNL